ncbi:MAG: restriction endonuclease [Bdellovibrionales bacterium]|nr:restriction endonuclease [Bdellovibrionales bacterium]
MRTNVKTFVRKYSGQMEPFSEEKLRKSLKRSGANPKVCDQIVDHVRSQISNGVTTRQVYKLAFKELRHQSKQFAATYSLKRALFDLGPSGFPFEKLVSQLFLKSGYTTVTNHVAKGKCVNHEIDVVAENKKERFLVECKFHNQASKNSDLKTSLYVHARSVDVMKSEKFNAFWLFTNTSFSEDAIKYGECAGLKLMGWNYPHENSLQNWIARSGLHPITSLSSLTQSEKKSLIESGIITCQDLLENQKTRILRSQKNFTRAVREAKFLIQS